MAITFANQGHMEVLYSEKHMLLECNSCQRSSQINAKDFHFKESVQ